jgi:hypothetical protein
MSGTKWSDEEIAVLVVFALWGFSHKAIAAVLTNRRAEIRAILEPVVPQYIRTVKAVDSKLVKVRQENPDLWSSTEGWNQRAVLEYLQQLNVDHQLVIRLLSLTQADIDIIHVCTLLEWIMDKILIAEN